MGRSFLAILSGYLAMALIIALGSAAAVALLVAPTGRSAPVIVLPPAFYVADFAFTLLGGIGGGWLTTRLAPRNPLAHAGALTGVLALIAVLHATGLLGTAPSTRIQHPAWYELASATISVVGVLIGGILRRKVRESGKT